MRSWSAAWRVRPRLKAARSGLCVLPPVCRPACLGLRIFRSRLGAWCAGRSPIGKRRNRMPACWHRTSSSSRPSSATSPSSRRETTTPSPCRRQDRISSSSQSPARGRGMIASRPTGHSAIGYSSASMGSISVRSLLRLNKAGSAWIGLTSGADQAHMRMLAFGRPEVPIHILAMGLLNLNEPARR